MCRVKYNINVTATGDDLSYQWTKSEYNINILGATNSTYSISKLQIADADIYRCIVSNSCGSRQVTHMHTNC